MSIEKMTERVGSKFMEAGCEKLPEGAMRDNCEKKSKGKSDDKKDDDKKDEKKKKAKKDVPESFKKEWKNKDKDGDGKTNEPKPDFLKNKKGGTIPGVPDGTGPMGDTEKCYFEDKDVPMGVVAAMTEAGKVEIFEASTPQAASSMKEALMKKGGYTKIASGPNVEQRSTNELYDDFEQRWASEEEDGE